MTEAETERAAVVAAVAGAALLLAGCSYPTPREHCIGGTVFVSLGQRDLEPVIGPDGKPVLCERGEHLTNEGK